MSLDWGGTGVARPIAPPISHGSLVRTDQLAKLLGRPVELVTVPFTGRYPRGLLRWEIIKASAGIVVCVGTDWLLRPSPWIGWPLAIVAGLFAWYLYQQSMRMALSYTVDDTGVTRIQRGRRTPLRWSELSDMRLNYYPNGRKAHTGVLVVVLRNGKGRFKVDSSLDQFPALLYRSAQAARERNLELHPTTQANLQQLDL